MYGPALAKQNHDEESCCEASKKRRVVSHNDMKNINVLVEVVS